MFVSLLFFFFVNDTATTEIYTLSLHDALPIWMIGQRSRQRNPLLLAPGKVRDFASGKTWQADALQQLSDIFVGHNLAALQGPEANIASHVARKQKRTLGHHAYAAAQ